MMSPTEVAEKIALLEQEIDGLKQRLAKLFATLKEYQQDPFRTLQLEKLTLKKEAEHPSATLQTQKPGEGFSPEVELSASSGVTIKLETDQSVHIGAGKYLHIVASSTFLECASVVVDGELAAKLKYSKPFIWRKSQGRVRLLHADRGFPIITGMIAAKGEFNKINTLLSVDPTDQYWYLDGSEGLEEVRAIFIGKL